MSVNYNKIPALINKILKNKKGISVVEILIVVVIISVGLVALLNATTSSLKFSRLMKENDQAKELAQEALEAVRSFRDGTDWEIDGLGFLPLGTYHPEQTTDSPPKWALFTNEGTVTLGAAIFKRKVVFENVYRDFNDNIASSGTEDLNTKKITATVSWDNGNKKVEISTYLTNWR
jgi:type II secretory pathway pseudopilin PulG